MAIIEPIWLRKAGNEMRKHNQKFTRGSIPAYVMVSMGKEILAYKDTWISFKEMRTKLNLEDIPYSTFRRHARRIWDNPDDLPQSVKDGSVPPVDLSILKKRPRSSK